MTLVTDVLEYPIDPSTRSKLTQFKTFAQMMNLEKEEKPSVQNIKPWKVNLLSQFQNSFTCQDGVVILLDGPATNPPKLRFYSGIEECLALADLVDSTRTTNSIPIPWNLKVNDISHKSVKYYHLYSLQEAGSKIPICKDTFRPYLIDIELRKDWIECSIEKYGPLDKQIHNNKYFIDYIVDMKKYPRREEFLKYIASRQALREKDPVTTLPAQIVKMVDGLFDDYRVVLGSEFQDVSVQEFIAVVKSSLNKGSRALLEGVPKLVI